MNFVTLVLLAAISSCAFTQGAGASVTRSSQHSSGADEATLAKSAQTARESDHSDEAIRLYSQLVQMKPESPEYWWYLAMLYYEADDYDKAQSGFRHVTGLKPKMSLGWAMLGLSEFETKHYDRALVHLERADALKIPKQEDFYDVAKYHLALLLSRSGDFEAAVTVLTDLSPKGKQGVQFAEAMGIVALRKPLLPQELPPGERELVLDVGHALIDGAGRRPNDVERDIAELLQKYPNTPEIHYLIGNMVLADDPDRALQEWQTELRVSPNHELALVNIAKEYMKRGSYQEALPFAERAASASPQLFIGHAVLGELLAEGNIDVARGIQELQVAEHIAPKQPQVHFALGTAYLKAGRKQDAQQEQAEFLRLRDQN
jgi:tetratricopeptide (TPR) repeat protein